MQQIFILKSVYSVAVVAMEIPSGYLADCWGRKHTLILGSILGFLGYFTYSLTSGFYMFLCAEVLLGIGQSFISGSDSALLYDTLREQNKEKDYLKEEGKITSIGNFAEAIAGVVGGLLATYSLKYPFYGQAFIAFFGIPAALSLVEPPRNTTTKSGEQINIWAVVKECLLHNKSLRGTIIFSSIIGNATLTMAWMLQAYFKQIELSVSLYGVVWTSLNLLVGLISMVAWRIEEKWTKRHIELFILLGISGCYLLVALCPTAIALVAIVAFYMVRGVATPILKDYINKRTDSSIRATVLSVRNFVIRICFALTGPFLGFFTDNFSLSSAFTLLGIIVFVAAGSTFLIHTKFDNQE